GQEIGITPLQLTAMISTIANDGVWVAPRIIAGTTEPRGTPQMVAFRPGVQRRVISPLTAAQMKQMMQGVVLHGTGKKAILEGYSSAGKTGTAQKVDPATRTYSRTKYVASFAGFAPINDPAVTVAVILDSAVGLHQGGQVSAPVFQRVTQQVLEYLHTPHDVELPPSRQVLLAERRVKDQDTEEGSPDRLGESLEATELAAADSRPEPALVPAPAPAQPTAGVTASAVVPAGLREREASPAVSQPMANGPLPAAPPAQPALPPLPSHLPTSGMVVLEVEQGGILVPSFLGKSVRAAIEIAQENGLDLDAVGSGLAREQSPPAGSHVASGSSVTVKFGR
ncbi:MAG: penicillin-binding transpeptidase domain-containing protein, partial [Terriglobales bacterium]